MSIQKQKKPFLKKGTRQFLSNAQVRSQSTKPRVVQFDQNENENYEQFTFTPSQKNNTSNQISIPVKVNKINKNNISSNMISQKNSMHLDKKIEKNKNSSVDGRTSAKKTNNLEDYLDLEQQPVKLCNRKTSINKKQNEVNNKKLIVPVPKPTFKSEQPIKISVSAKEKQLSVQNKPTSLVSMLHKQQDQQQDSQQQIVFENQSIEVPKTSMNYHFQNKQKQQIKIATNDRPIIPKKSNEGNIYYSESQLKKSQTSNSDSQKEQNQFIDHNKKQQRSTPNSNFNDYLKFKETQTTQNFQQTIVSQNKPSKVQKLFGINKAQPELINTKFKNQYKPLTIEDIPQQLKNQIIVQQMKQNKQQLQSKLKILNEQINAVKKQKNRFEQQSRALNKAKIEFQKSMEEKQRQFEEKVKAENKKLNVQKKYRKELQTTSKEDWKYKNQLQEVKKQLEEVISDKKKNQSKFKIEIQRLKKRLEEETQKNKMLTQEVKLLQYGKLIQKEIVKENNREIVKKQNKNDYWIGAPKKSYLQRFLDENFSLIQFPKQYYQFDANQYYQFYNQVKDQPSQLEQESTQNDKVKRVYQNGKIQQEYYNKLLKEIFPFKYTVIHHVNGDVKQILPEGIIIYFDKTNANVQFKITPDKKIIFFCRNGQAQLHWDTPKGKIVECYNGKILKRILPDGHSEYLSNVQDGQIFHLRGE